MNASRDHENFSLGVTEQTVREWRAWGWSLDERISQRGRLNAYRYQRYLSASGTIQAR